MYINNIQSHELYMLVNDLDYKKKMDVNSLLHCLMKKTQI